jgi:iron complex outermembrane receptor protein
LYYSDPTSIGNPNLKPESAWSGEAGADWKVNSQLSVSATGFYSRQHDTIDYVRTATLPSAFLPSWCPVNMWCAVNLSGLRFAGVESSATWVPAKGQRVQFAWTTLLGAQPPFAGLQSEYALNYPVQNVYATWTTAVSKWMTITNSIQIAKKYQQLGIAPWNPSAYPVWNGSLVHDSGRFRPYLRLGNLSNTGYQEISGVAMPGRSITGGLSIWLGK